MKTCLVLPQASSHTIPHTRQLQQLHFILPICQALVLLVICPGCSLHLSVTAPKVSFYLVFRLECSFLKEAFPVHLIT